jgi:2',3'-cyclic-nucleotide 2'-phosphodiesterase
LRILFIGDIMGRSGREALEKYLPPVRAKLKPDVVIVNGENAASGAGITDKICKQFYEWGVDCITTGNHVWDQREIMSYIGRDKRLLRPLNYPDTAPGSGIYRHELKDGRSITVINAMARLFMDPLDDPFRKTKDVLAKEKLGKTSTAIFIDFHGETTSEKLSFAHYFDGQVSAVVGTHTHIPTADTHVMPGGTAYMTDAGMTGDYNSVIGVEKRIAMNRFVTKMPGEKMKPADGPGMMSGCFIITNDKTGKAERIEPVRQGAVLTETLPNL